MKKNLLFLLLISALLLTACNTSPPSPATEPSVSVSPVPIDIGGTPVKQDTAELNLAGCAFDLDLLLAAAPKLNSVSRIDLGVTGLSPEQISLIRTAFPHAALTYSVNILNQTISCDTEELTLSSTNPNILEPLSLLPRLKKINFISEEGIRVFTAEDIPTLELFRQALPEVRFSLKFELFGKVITSEDERIEYCRIPIGNDGAAQIRAVLPYLYSCQYLLLDGCEMDNEVMAQLRDDFPDTRIVWRVWLGEPNYENEFALRRRSFLTDTEVIWTKEVNDENCDVLKYCTETRYVDFGHNHTITTCEFLGYMPNLEVAVLALTKMNDLSPLASCTKLEYLELFSSAFSDLSPLANCKELKHLNIANLPEVTDITPLYGLTKLERLRVIRCKVPSEQVEEFSRRVPDCTVMDTGWDPTGNGWRIGPNGQVPRYKLLRQQLQYGNGDY